jgi:hypothetical protein
VIRLSSSEEKTTAAATELNTSTVIRNSMAGGGETRLPGKVNGEAQANHWATQCGRKP